MPRDDLSGALEAQIRAARERGDFDDLPGHGKPLEPDMLAGLSADARFEALLLRSFGELSPEVTLLREIREGHKQLAACTSAEERSALLASQRAKAEALSKLVRRTE